MTPSNPLQFHRCTPWLQEALAHDDGNQTLEEVREKIESGECHLWSSPSAVIVTEYIDEESLGLMLAGGESLEPILDLYQEVEAWAREQGYEEVLLFGRSGWHRAALRQIGFTVQRVVLVKDIRT